MRRHVPRAGWRSSGVIGLALLTASLVLTGVGMHHWANASLADLADWENRLRRIAAVGHGTLAWLACLLAGRWVWPHVALVWRRRRRNSGWWLGLLTLATGACLALAGLLLLYGPADWRESLSDAHWWLGLVWPALWLVHASRRGLADRWG